MFYIFPSATILAARDTVKLMKNRNTGHDEYNSDAAWCSSCHKCSLIAQKARFAQQTVTANTRPDVMRPHLSVKRSWCVTARHRRTRRRAARSALPFS